MQESTIKKYLPWVVATALLMLEVFGEHHLDMTYTAVLFLLSLALLAAYVWHARDAALPLLRLTLFKVHTFRVAVGGGFVLLGLTPGFFNSLQFSSMNTLAYADIDAADTSMASSFQPPT